MQAAMVVTWKQPFPGREIKALEYGAEVMEFWSKQAAEAKCSEPELFFSDRGTGLWIVKGDRGVLEELHTSDTGVEFEIKGQLLLEDFSVDFMLAGEAANAYMGRYGAVAAAVI